MNHNVFKGLLNSTLRITYKNYRNVIEERVVTPKSVFYGSTRYHPDEQWLLEARCHSRKDNRVFAIRDIMCYKQM
jgi:hypothetical protein